MLPKRFFAALAAFVFVAPPATLVGAAVDPATAPLPPVEIELVVVEAGACTYCALFRENVEPAYRATARAERVPMRYADINAVEASRLELVRPVASLPTVLVIRGGREIGRIEGYVGPELFFQSLGYLLTTAH